MANDIVCNVASIRLASTADIADVRELIDSRIEWMDRNNIAQWNTSLYTMKYNYNYFLKAVYSGELYIAQAGATTLGAFVLLIEDSRWTNDIPAYYVHNLATSARCKGIGRKLLDYCFELARKDGKKALRLDCSVSNPKLNDYYERQGFAEIGPFEEGVYHGIKRERKIA